MWMKYNVTTDEKSATITKFAAKKGGEERRRWVSKSRQRTEEEKIDDELGKVVYEPPEYVADGLEMWWASKVADESEKVGTEPAK